MKGCTPADIKVGAVGLGLMGTSIVACLLAAGHCVVGIEVEDRRRRHARRRVLALLHELRQEGLINSEPRSLIDRFVVSRDYALLAGTKVVIEAITESLRAKSRAHRRRDTGHDAYKDKMFEYYVAHRRSLRSFASSLVVMLAHEGIANVFRAKSKAPSQTGHLSSMFGGPAGSGHGGRDSSSRWPPSSVRTASAVAN